MSLAEPGLRSPGRLRPPLSLPVDGDPHLPAHADVVVAGGGIVGASAAYALARQGVSTVLCEKGRIGGEQSGRNWGWVRKMGRDPQELPLMIEAERLWREFKAAAELDTGYQDAGIVYLCKTEAELAVRQGWLDRVGAFDLDSRFLSRGEIDSLLPGLKGAWRGALFTASDGRAEPQLAAPAFATAAQRAGAVLKTDCAVRGVETAAGRVSAAVTEQGPIRCGAVVLAGGAWSGLFCRSLRVRLPQLKVLASVMRIDGVRAGPVPAAWGSGFAFRRRKDGGYSLADGSANLADIVPDSFRYLFDFLPVLKIEWPHLRLRLGSRFLEELKLPKRWPLDGASPFERVRVLDPAPSNATLNAALRSLMAALPAFETARITDRWAGLIDATPDALPVISGIDALPGLFLATGFSGHGFGIGPGAGRLVADIVTNQRPLVDPKPFRHARFSDGSKPMPSTGL